MYLNRRVFVMESSHVPLEVRLHTSIGYCRHHVEVEKQLVTLSHNCVLHSFTCISR